MARASLAASVAPISDATNILTTTASTITQLNNYGVYNFVDEFGNVTQIKKSVRKRIEFYPELVDAPLIEPCVIGVKDPVDGNCTEGVAMGCGDVGSSTEMAYAIY